MHTTMRINAEPSTCNQTVHQLDLYNRHRMHLQRLHEISVAGKRRADLGNTWRTGPQRSRPTYAHLRDNLKKQQLEAERFETIEHENRLLLEKMSALMASGSVLDPTEGTWEFQPGVRLNRFQMPVIDHAVSHQPPMPQRGAAKEPESLNWGARRRELDRIMTENRGIVHRIQGRGSYYPANQWSQRSKEHDEHLLLIRRPPTREVKGGTLPTPPSPVMPTRKPRRRRPRLSKAVVTSLLVPAKVGDTHLLVGLSAGLDPNTPITLASGEEAEEEAIVLERHIRNDGLFLLLRAPVQNAHPANTRLVGTPQPRAVTR